MCSFLRWVNDRVGVIRKTPTPPRLTRRGRRWPGPETPLRRPGVVPHVRGGSVRAHQASSAYVIREASESNKIEDSRGNGHPIGPGFGAANACQPGRIGWPPGTEYPWPRCGARVARGSARRRAAEPSFGEFAMQRCKNCGRPMARDDAGRRQWCRDIRSLFVLTHVVPEDYHPNCFLDALIEHRIESVPTGGPADHPPSPNSRPPIPNPPPGGDRQYARGRSTLSSSSPCPVVRLSPCHLVPRLPARPLDVRPRSADPAGRPAFRFVSAGRFPAAPVLCRASGAREACRPCV